MAYRSPKFVDWSMIAATVVIIWAAVVLLGADRAGVVCDAVGPSISRTDV